MPVKATINGEVWEFSTAAEAAEFKRAMAAPQAAAKQPAARPKPQKRRAVKPAKAVAVSLSPQNGHGLSKGSREILQVVRRLPAEGVQSPDFARAIGSPSARSIPVRMMVLGKELLALGLKPEDVVQSRRIYVKGKGVSIFSRGPKLEDALRQGGDLFTTG